MFSSLDPISFFQSPMSLILHKTHNSLLDGDTHLSNSTQKLTANVEMQMEQQIKTYFSFFPKTPAVFNKSLSRVSVFKFSVQSPGVIGRP